MGPSGLGEVVDVADRLAEVPLVDGLGETEPLHDEPAPRVWRQQRRPWREVNQGEVSREEERVAEGHGLGTKGQGTTALAESQVNGEVVRVLWVFHGVEEQGQVVPRLPIADADSVAVEEVPGAELEGHPASVGC